MVHAEVRTFENLEDAIQFIEGLTAPEKPFDGEVIERVVRKVIDLIVEEVPPHVDFEKTVLGILSLLCATAGKGVHQGDLEAIEHFNNQLLDLTEELMLDAEDEHDDGRA